MEHMLFVYEGFVEAPRSKHQLSFFEESTDTGFCELCEEGEQKKRLLPTFHLSCSRGGAVQTQAMAKQLHFNKNMEALKKLQAGVDKLSSVVGVTLGPKVRPLPLISLCKDTEVCVEDASLRSVTYR